MKVYSCLSTSDFVVRGHDRQLKVLLVGIEIGHNLGNRVLKRARANKVTQKHKTKQKTKTKTKIQFV